MSSLFFFGEFELALIRIILILGIPLILAFYLFGKYFMEVRKEKKMAETFRESSQALVKEKGFQMRPPGSAEGAGLIEVLKSCERLKLANVRFFIHDQAVKKQDDKIIAAFFYKWTKTRKFRSKDTHRSRSAFSTEEDRYHTETTNYLRTGIYFPLSLEIGEPIYVRGRKGWEEEDQLELDEGMPTPPAVGIPDFDLSFVCKGKNPMETGKVVTKEMQELILSHQGKYPVLPEKNQLMRVYFSELGINFTVEDAPDEKQLLEMYDLAEKIYNLTQKQSSPDEEIITAP